MKSDVRQHVLFIKEWLRPDLRLEVAGGDEELEQCAPRSRHCFFLIGRLIRNIDDLKKTGVGELFRAGKFEYSKIERRLERKRNVQARGIGLDSYFHLAEISRLLQSINRRIHFAAVVRLTRLQLH